MYIPIFVNLHH